MRHLILIISLFGVSACGTVSTFVQDAEQEQQTLCSSDCTIPRVYSGIAWDICKFSKNDVGLLRLIDLPISLAFDTLSLPYTIYKQVKHGALEKRVNCVEVPKRPPADNHEKE